MADEHAWVTLVECQDVGELHAVRAALEAHGVPCRISGEHTHGIFGAMHGSIVRSRVLVPQPGLVPARRLIEGIVGPFDEAPPPEDAVDEAPFRRSAAEAAEREEDEPASAAPELRPKSYGRLLIVVSLLIAPLFGLGHVYAGRPRRAGALALLTLFAVGPLLQGAAWAWWLLAAVWIADIAGAIAVIAAHNARVAARRRQAALPADGARVSPRS